MSGKFEDTDGKSWTVDGVLSYKGGYKNGKFCGQGENYQVTNGEVIYNGNFSEGKYNGEGKLFYDMKTVSKWNANFERNAEVSESFQTNLLGASTPEEEIDEIKDFLKMSDSDKQLVQYEGEFSDGNFHGDGKFFYPNAKLKFEGNF